MAGAMELLGLQRIMVRNVRLHGLVPRLSRLECRRQSVGFGLKRLHSGLCCFESTTPLACSVVVQAGGRLLDTLNTKQLQQVDTFVNILMKYNSEKFNLTAVTERSEVLERHVEDSLALLPVIQAAYTEHCSNLSQPALKLVDVGSGAGLPGVILAIARPDWKITLLDCIEKRCKFLKDAAHHSGLDNVVVVNSRAEDTGHDMAYRESFDVAVARAVAEMRVLAELCLPLVRIGGILVAAKGANPQKEIDGARKAVSLLGGRITSLSTVESMSSLGLRTAVVCFKAERTPLKYPRQAGIPKKKPL